MEPAVTAIIVVFCLGIGIAVSSVERRRGQMEHRLKRMERRVDAIIEQLGISTDERDLEQVDTVWKQGKKIQAIRLYREITGAGLAEAREAVERRAADPDPGRTA